VAKYRFGKFERNQTPKAFRIGEIDLVILNDLAENRFVDSQHIIVFAKLRRLDLRGKG